jgi:TolA-binding protein
MMVEPCRAELAMRARRGTLTTSSQLAFEAHLSECESCRMDQQLLADLDEDAAVEIRDGARLERLAAAARSWAGARREQGVALRSVQRRHPRAWAAAAALLLAGTAAAAWWTVRPAAHSPQPAPVRQPAPPTHTARPPVPVEFPPAVALGAANPGLLAAAPASPQRARSSPRVTAATLLRQAGEARKAGEAERAVALYRKLRADFAGSPEALLARVPLGGLLLERGRSREALAELDGYLDVAPTGALLPEALYGRARALAAMGETAEAQRTWRRLLRDFPASAYAPLARRRIGEFR